MRNKPRVNHRLLPHTTMSMRDKSVINESHPMIILKEKFICSLNQKFWMPYSNYHFFYKTMCLLSGREFSGSHCRLRTPFYTFTSFHHWKRINHIYRVCSDPRARPDPVGGSEPKPRGCLFNSFYSHFIMFSFSKVSRPESPARPEGQIRTRARFTPTFSFILTNIYLCYIILGFRLHGSIFK